MGIMSSEMEDTVPDMIGTELECLVRVDKHLWERKVLRVKEDNLSFLNVDSFCEETTVQPDCCLSAKSISEKRLVISACPKNKGVRKLMNFDIEFESKANVQNLVNFMNKSNYIPAKRKKILVIINPASGKGKAPKIWKQIAEITASTEIEFEVVLTKRAGHAKDMLQQLDVHQYGGVVTVSGDGGLWEITNGLYLREDWNDIRGNFPLGLVPGGSGHAMHCSLLYHQKEL